MEATGSGRGGCRCRLQPVFTTAHQSQPSANSHFNPISVPPSPYLHLRRVLKMCVQICNAYHQVSGRNPVNLLLVSARTDKYSTRALYFLGPARTGTWQGPGGAPTVWQALNAGEQCAFTLPAPLLPRDAQPQPQQREAARAREEGRESNAAKGGAPRKWPRQTVRRSPPSLYLQHQTRGNPQRGWHLEQVEIGNYLILTVMVPDSGGAETGPKSRVCLRDNAQLHSDCPTSTAGG
jgi:hypothetical protein